MFVVVFNLLHNKGIRGNLSIGGLIRRKLNRRACHHRRGTFCLLEFCHDECTRQTSPSDPCCTISSSFTVMFRLLGSSRNIGPFVCMFLVLRLCFLWRNTGLSRGEGGGGGSSRSLAARSASNILAFRTAAPARPAATFFGSFVLLFLVVSGTGSGAAWSITLSTSSAICWFFIIVCCLRALMSKLAARHWF